MLKNAPWKPVSGRATLVGSTAGGGPTRGRAKAPSPRFRAEGRTRPGHPRPEGLDEHDLAKAFFAAGAAEPAPAGLRGEHFPVGGTPIEGFAATEDSRPAEPGDGSR